VTPDFAVIGGGIVGCALAAFLAEAGASVTLYERAELAAGASGRNSGVLQHPLDAALAGLYEESIAQYRELGHGFDLPEVDAGLLIVSDRPEALAAGYAEAAAAFPELAPALLDERELAAAEPALAAGLHAYRLQTGRPVPPGVAARAFAARARAAGAELRIGESATIAIDGARATGVTVGGALRPAGAVAVAAGPWTPAALGLPVAIAPLWGVVAELELAAPPRHVIEEVGVDALTEPGAPARTLFSIVTAGGISAVGSTFEPDEPDAAAHAPGVIEHGARFVPALAGARPRSLRACARPASADGRPLLGPLGGVAGLAIASGHGPWGISLGPGSARLVADGLLGRPAAIAPELAAGRF
jgi:D-amino-acid dehydrogenase